MNILFLERDRATRRLVKDMLEQAGATLIEGESAADVEPALRDRPIAIAIVEMGAGSEGDVVIARLSDSGATRPAVIALAESAAEADSSRRAGADAVLIEPVPMTALFEAIARYLPEG